MAVFWTYTILLNHAAPRIPINSTIEKLKFASNFIINYWLIRREFSHIRKSTISMKLYIIIPINPIFSKKGKIKTSVIPTANHSIAGIYYLSGRINLKTITTQVYYWEKNNRNPIWIEAKRTANNPNNRRTINIKKRKRKRRSRSRKLQIPRLHNHFINKKSYQRKRIREKAFHKR
jgi:hypothetical protein